MKILFLGALPPPLGGVSIYCMRKIELLHSNNQDYVFFDSRFKYKFIYLLIYAWFLIIKGIDFEIEVNVSNPLSLFALRLFGLSSKSIFFDHNGSRRLLSSKVGSLVFRFFLRKIKRIVVVNDKLVDNYNGLNGNFNLEVHTPFIPPSSFEITEAKKQYQGKHSSLLDSMVRNIVLTSAWKPISDEKTNDLYGIFQTLVLYEDLLQKYPNIKFVLMIGELGNDEFSGSIEKYVHRLNNHKNFIFLSGGLSQLPLLDKTIVLLRLTKTDGDSVSVKEALHFGAKVIATNIAPRPETVLLVEPNDINSVKSKLINLLNGSL